MGSQTSNLSSPFVIYVKTGDRRSAGTDANVTLRLFDDTSCYSEPINLNNIFKNDLERGCLDKFKVPKSKVMELDDNAKIIRIELWRDDAGISSNWLVDTITVENRATETTFVFPIFRWIKKDHHYNIKHLDTCLPQFDKFFEQRKTELEEKRKAYEYEQKYEGGPVQVKNVPDDENFSFSYKWDIVSLKLKLLSKTRIMKLFTTRKFENLKAITKIYDDVLPKPKDFNGWKDDSFFGYQRIASHNPSLIRLATEIPDKFPVTDAIVWRLMEGLSLKAAMAKKRLFICDYELMEGVSTKKGYTICIPIGLFFINKDGELRPLAIQLFQRPGKDNPIFTPEDPQMLWCLVKMWYNNADAAYHQSITHLAGTHFLMEGITIAVHRNISQSHPVFKLLAPHFLYIIAINARGLKKLLPVGGWVDNNMNAATVGTIELILRGSNSWRMDKQGILPEDLKMRGLSDPAVLPCYHYREDALDVYEAIKKYVTSYVMHYYGSNHLLEQDDEIQNWVRELVAERGTKGVGLKGVPGNGKITCTAELIQILTSIIFTCSVTHAASNFPQYGHYCYPPNYPALMNGVPPTSKDVKITEKVIRKALPNRPTTLDIMVVTKLLSTKSTQSLGDFEVNYVFDPEASSFLDEFKKDLESISGRITARNEKRKYVYDYLDPRYIPNSISI